MSKLKRAAARIASFAGQYGPTPPAGLVSNILTDLLHYCAANGVDFEDAYHLAEIGYHAECKEDATNG